jgi:hypothetical protein
MESEANTINAIDRFMSEAEARKGFDFYFFEFHFKLNEEEAKDVGF